jgi:PTH1 family peptidyl-tRNA hydrolase
MEVGTLKLKTNSSSGGHNGIKNIEDELNTNAIKRLKIGISNTKEDTIEYVLGKFSKQEQEVIENLSDTVVNILEEFPTVDFERLMNKYN